MSTEFNPTLNLVIITAYLEGPDRGATVVLALDTGATATSISTNALLAIGVDLVTPVEMVRLTTGSSSEYVPIFEINILGALEQEQLNFPVIALDLPPSAVVDGVLGLIFAQPAVNN